MDYPFTKKIEQEDNYHGTIVKDHYRWLENEDSEDTKAWIESQRAFYDSTIEGYKGRSELRLRLKELHNYPKYDSPKRSGDLLYYFYNSGNEPQSSLWRRDSVGKSEMVISSDSSALMSVYFSEDDRYIATLFADAGSDWNEIRIFDTTIMEFLNDSIKWVKFSDVQWRGDGFYYSGFNAPVEAVFSNENVSHKIFHHKIGEKGSTIIYQNIEESRAYCFAKLTKERDAIIIEESLGTSGTKLLLYDLASEELSSITKGYNNDYSFIECVERELLVLTNRDADNFKLIKINLDSLVEMSVIEQKRTLLGRAVASQDFILTDYLINASSSLKLYNKSGGFIRNINIPRYSTATLYSNDGNKFYIGVQNFTQPNRLYVYDAIEDVLTPIFGGEVTNKSYITKREYIKSKDGKTIAYFIIYKQGLDISQHHRVHLYGYGGFNINITPTYSPMNELFMESDGVYVVANLRGGGEYGEDWHRDGMLSNKQTVFDDFISIAEHLIIKGYCTNGGLSISGGSNGGLLTAAVMLQRPDLFGAVVSRVGVLDMLRYHLFTIGWGWIVEYGCSGDKSQFEYIYKYSPLHNIKDGVKYPPTLIATGDHDDRVVPAHSFKFGATLQSACLDSDVLIRIDKDAGHGLCKPIDKLIAEQIDILLFVIKNTC